MKKKVKKEEVDNKCFYLWSIARYDLVKDAYTLEEVNEIRNAVLGLNNSKKLEIDN